MTVKELIESLSKCEPDASVYMLDWNEEDTSPTLVNGVRAANIDEWDKRADGEVPDDFINGVVLT